jgi:hypothetical protein
MQRFVQYTKLFCALFLWRALKIGAARMIAGPVERQQPQNRHVFTERDAASGAASNQVAIRQREDEAPAEPERRGKRRLNRSFALPICVFRIA